eukprot:6186510-Pleurochrysis_carterae.AAC.1
MGKVNSVLASTECWHEHAYQEAKQAAVQFEPVPGGAASYVEQPVGDRSARDRLRPVELCTPL